MEGERLPIRTGELHAGLHAIPCTGALAQELEFLSDPRCLVGRYHEGPLIHLSRRQGRADRPLPARRIVRDREVIGPLAFLLTDPLGLDELAPRIEQLIGDGVL